MLRVGLWVDALSRACCPVGHAPPSGAPQPRVHLSRVSLSHTPARRAGQTVISFKAMGNSTSRVLGSPAEPNAPEGSAPAEEQPVVTVCSTSIDSNAPTNALSPSGEKEQAPAFSKPGQIKCQGPSLDDMAVNLISPREVYGPNQFESAAANAPSNTRSLGHEEEIRSVRTNLRRDRLPRGHRTPRR
eukprot:3437867-Prymnesium_polylepis.2